MPRVLALHTGGLWAVPSHPRKASRRLRGAVKDPETPQKEARKYRLLLPLGCGCAVKFSV